MCFIYRIACAKLFKIGSIPSTLRISFTFAFFSLIKLVRRIKYLKKRVNLLMSNYFTYGTMNIASIINIIMFAKFDAAKNIIKNHI